jgi:hypothetical protein
MALVVEDGTGLTNAQSLCSVATADSYWTTRGGTLGESWGAAVVVDKELALARASDYVRNQSRYRWRGSKKTYAQRMPWPRLGAVERDGPAIPETVVPWQVAEAVSYLAARSVGGEDLSPDLARGGRIVSERIDVLSTTYGDDASPYDILQVVDGLLAPLLRQTLDDSMSAAPVYEQPSTPDGFNPGEFENGT